MNRFLFGGCLMIFLGCGARSGTFSDLDGASGAFGVAGTFSSGGRSVAGAASVAGGVNVAGTSNVGAGGNSAGGSFGTGGASLAGGPSKGGAPGFGGSGNVAGWSGRGGTTGVGGGGNVAGWFGTGGGGTSAIEQACQAIANNSCQQCLCSSCSTQIVKCVANIGCALILACAQQTGCQGVSCYKADTCKPIIDQFGGLNGSAVQNVFDLASCASVSQSTCNCN